MGGPPASGFSRTTAPRSPEACFESNDSARSSARTESLFAARTSSARKRFCAILTSFIVAATSRRSSAARFDAAAYMMRPRKHSNAVPTRVWLFAPGDSANEPRRARASSRACASLGTSRGIDSELRGTCTIANADPIPGERECRGRDRRAQR